MLLAAANVARFATMVPGTLSYRIRQSLSRVTRKKPSPGGKLRTSFPIVKRRASSRRLTTITGTRASIQMRSWLADDAPSVASQADRPPPTRSARIKLWADNHRHSVRSASTGSARAARHAGTTDARTTITSSTTATTASVAGSRGPMP